ncbi:hypothetical protein ACQ4PT_037382 [Festuca glaucescens]
MAPPEENHSRRQDGDRRHGPESARSVRSNQRDLFLSIPRPRYRPPYHGPSVRHPGSGSAAAARAWNRYLATTRADVNALKNELKEAVESFKEASKIYKSDSVQMRSHHENVKKLFEEYSSLLKTGLEVESINMNISKEHAAELKLLAEELKEAVKTLRTKRGFNVSTMQNIHKGSKIAYDLVCDIAFMSFIVTGLLVFAGLLNDAFVLGVRVSCSTSIGQNGTIMSMLSGELDALESRLLVQHIAEKWKSQIVVSPGRDVALNGGMKDFFFKGLSVHVNLPLVDGLQRKVTLVEFWLRFDTALECQRQEELIADNSSIHRTPQLVTPWPLEKQGSEVFTYEVFEKFQKQIIAARDHCCVQSITQDKGIQTVSFRTGDSKSVYDVQGNLLEEKPADSLDVAARKKISAVRNKLEDLIQTAKQSDEGMEFLLSSVLSIEEPLNQKVPTAVKHTRQEEYEAFIGCNIPNEVNIHPPNDVCSVGRSKRIKRGKEMNGEEQKKKNKEAKAKVARMCRTCNTLGFHDSRKCPSKNGQGKEVNVHGIPSDGAS